MMKERLCSGVNLITTNVSLLEQFFLGLCACQHNLKSVRIYEEPVCFHL